MLRLLAILNKLSSLHNESSALGGGGTPPPPPPPAGTPPPPPPPPAPAGGTPTWRDTLPAELKDDQTLANFSDVNALAAAHVSLKRHLGADKIPVPGKMATDEDWQNVFTKLGLPPELKDYGVTFADGLTLNDEFKSTFLSTAHKNGILPKQAQAMVNWFSELNTKAEADTLASLRGKQEQDIAALKNEWGNAYQANITAANRLIRENGGEDFIKYLDSTGLGNDVQIIKMISKLAGAFYGEDKAKGQGSGASSSMAPADAKKAALAIINDKSNPMYEAYHTRLHPNHNAAMQEVQRLFADSAPQQT